MLTFDSAILDPARRTAVVNAAFTANGLVPADHVAAVTALVTHLNTIAPTAPDTFQDVFTVVAELLVDCYVKLIVAGAPIASAVTAITSTIPAAGNSTVAPHVPAGGAVDPTAALLADTNAALAVHGHAIAVIVEHLAAIRTTLVANGLVTAP